uniref:SWIM-type domain-containing protein n=1 Tax=Lactuca sativa TaxID=4236 RepID=A0A9R1UH19_LACSA|nr:hypothetical protein LSAT_V11C900495010 [Lactuca sativa]
MKGPFPGQVLTTVGLDSNNGIYPLAYAIVESENTVSWKWFLENLGDDLELASNSNYTFISDRQKGLQIAFDQLFPNAEHRWNGANKFQVTGALQDQHVVDVRNQTCTCRKRELMGIPCRHAIATLNEMSRDPQAELDIYKWVHKMYWLETWQKAYSFKVEPIKGRLMWLKSNCPTKLTPPPHRTQVGRPKKKRRQSEGERLSKRQKASQDDGVNEMQGEHSQGPTNDGVQKLSRKHISLWFDDVVMYGVHILVCLTW